MKVVKEEQLRESNQGRIAKEKVIKEKKRGKKIGKEKAVRRKQGGKGQRKESRKKSEGRNQGETGKGKRLRMN